MLNFSNCKVNYLPVLFMYLCACLSICLFRPRLPSQPLPLWAVHLCVCLFFLLKYLSYSLSSQEKTRTRQDKSKT